MDHKIKIRTEQSKPMNKHPLFIFIFFVMLTSATAISGTFWFLKSFSTQAGTYGLIGLLGLTAFGPILYRLIRQRFDLPEPAIWFAAFFFFDFGTNALYDMVFGSIWLNHSAGTNDMKLINIALAVSILGLASFWGGYSLPIGRVIACLIPPLPSQWKRSRIFSVAMGCFLIAWGLRFYMITSQNNSFLGWLTGDKDWTIRLASGLFTYIRVTYLTLGSAGIVLLFILYRKFSCKKHLPVFWTLLFLEMIFLFVEGKRICLPSLLLSLLIISYMISSRTHQTSIRLLYILLAILIIAVLLYPAITMMRFGVENPVSTLISSGYYHPTALFQMVGRNLHSLDSLAMVIRKVPAEIPYSYGSEITKIPYAFIPRAIWPEKPIINPDDLFRKQFVRAGLVAEGVAVSISLPGEFYWDCGIFGVFIGMGGFGILWKCLYIYFVKPKKNLSNNLITSIVFIWFFMILQQNVVNFTAHAYALALLITICTLVAKKNNKRYVSG